MGVALLLLQVALAVVFGVAAVAKSYRPDRTRVALVGFGVAERFVPVFGAALLLIEGSIGVLLLPFVAPRLGAYAALCMLAAFTVVVARSLARGQAVECNCFGVIRPRPIGWHTLVRNALLMAATGIVAALGPGAASLRAQGWLAGLATIDLVLLMFLGIVLAVLLGGGGYAVHLFRDLNRRLDALERREGGPVAAPPPRGLAVGIAAPSFGLLATDGTERRLEALLAPGKPLALFFVHPDCGPCSMLLPRIVKWNATHGERLRITLMTTTSERGSSPPEYRVLETLLDQGEAMAKVYQVTAIPTAVLVNPDGTIGSLLAIGEFAIGNLIDAVTL